jgi:cobyrinic acid a,c-diamide synthase
MREGLRALATAGRPIYAECGGLMYLASAIVDRTGTRHPMLDLVPGDAVMCDALQALGYVEVETRQDTPLGPAGTCFRGHQFRYSRFESPVAPERYAVRRPRTGTTDEEGYGTGTVLASYVHAHWASNPSIADAFVAACVSARRSAS